MVEVSNTRGDLTHVLAETNAKKMYRHVGAEVLADYVKEELNVAKIVSANPEEYGELRAEPNKAELLTKCVAKST